MYDKIKSLPREWIDKYQDSFEKHLMYFKEAAIQLDVPNRIITLHDESKFSNDEFHACVKRFGGGVIDDDEFNLAWLHHIRENQHHWEHWIIPVGGIRDSLCCVEMPEVYIREMVADWMGSSKSYTGSFDMTDWLGNNLYKVRLYDVSRETLRKLLVELGYDIVDASGGLWSTNLSSRIIVDRV